MEPHKTAELLQKNIDLVTGERAQQYGDKKINFDNIARLWSAYLDVDISPTQVCILMALLKGARIKTASSFKNCDNFVDGAAYFRIAGELIDGGK